MFMSSLFARPMPSRQLLPGLLLSGLLATAVSARADSVTAYTSFDNIIEASGPYFGDSRMTVENPNAGATFADFAVIDFTKADLSLNFTASSFSNLQLNLTDRSSLDTSFAKAGTFDLYYTLDTATSIARGNGSPLKYTGKAVADPTDPTNYYQGITTDGTPTGPSQFTSAPVLLGTNSYAKTGANTVETFSLANIPSSVFLNAVNGANGVTGLRLILAPHDGTVAASFYGYAATNGANGVFRPNVTFDAVLNKTALNWKTGDGQWLAAGASGDTSWNGGPWVSGNVATFGGAPGTVTLSAPITASGLQFDSTGYTVTGTTSNPLTLTGGATIQVTNAADTATVGAQLSGSAGLNKVGLGTLVLTNAANNYTGTNTITAGTLAVGANGNLGAQGNAVALANGTLKTSSPVTLGAGRAFSGAGVLDMTGGALTVNGTVALSTLTVVNGAATFTNTASFTSADVKAGASLNLPGGFMSGARTTLSGDGAITLGDSSSFSSGFSVSKGTGLVGPTLTLVTGSSLGSGQANVNAGALQAPSDISITTQISLGGNATIGGTTAGTTGAIEFAGLFGFFGSAKKTMTINVPTSILGGISSSTSANPNSSLNKDGLARLTLTSAFNTYNGGTTVTGGTLEVGNVGTLGTGAVAVTAMAVAHVTLQVDNDQSIDDLSDVILTSNGSFHGRLDLEFATTDSPEIINSLVIDGKPVGAGTYRASDLQVLYPGIILGNGRLTINKLGTAPEPSTYLAMVAGAALLAGCKVRRKLLG